MDDFKNYLKDKQVSEEIRLKRVDICNDCDRKGVALGFEVCLECNCILNIKQRMRVSCPLDKW